MLVGFTALSVEISTMAETPAARAASATLRVPAALVSRSSSGFSSPIGTCLSAAAWKTSSGCSSSITRRSRELIAHIGDHGATRHGGMALAELEIDLPQRELAAVEQHDALRPEGCDLAGELRADRAAGAGDEHAPPLDEAGHAVAVERHLRPVEQILDRDGAELEPIAGGLARRGR